jgi:hypothetical protein
MAAKGDGQVIFLCCGGRRLSLSGRDCGVEMERRLHDEAGTRMRGAQVLEHHRQAQALRGPVHRQCLAVCGDARAHRAEVDPGKVLAPGDEASHLIVEEANVPVNAQ